jgi:hypothetical protein
MVLAMLMLFTMFTGVQALEDLRSVENSFSDLHRRYEKMKATIDGFKNVSCFHVWLF